MIQAYNVAAENHDLQHFKTVLQDHQQALQRDIEEREARAAAKAAKADKKKRKSTDAAKDDDVDMDDAGDDEEAPKSKGSKKRKKEEDSEGDSEKVRCHSRFSSAVGRDMIADPSRLGSL